MALPASPPISFSQVRTEFGGGSPPASFSAYYRGGGYVPNIGANAAVSTTAAGLALSQFYSTVSLTLINPTPSGTISSDAVDPGTATASLNFNTDGTISGGDSFGVSAAWCTPTGGSPGNTCHVYFQQASGSGPTAGSASLNTWLALSSQRTLLMARTGTGTRTGTFNVYVSSDGGATQTTAGVITLTATVDPV